jgi:hypothetical protein
LFLKEDVEVGEVQTKGSMLKDVFRGEGKGKNSQLAI